MSGVFHQESISVRPWADLKVKWRHLSALDNFFDSSHHPCRTLSSRSPALSVMLRWIGHWRVDWLLECGVGDPLATQRWMEGVFFCQPKPFTLWSSSIPCSGTRGKINLKTTTQNVTETERLTVASIRPFDLITTCTSLKTHQSWIRQI